MTLTALVAAPPSGRSRPLLLEDSAYSVAVLRQGLPVPWTDSASLAGYFGQIQSLFDPDAVWFDVGAWQAAHLDAAPQVVADIGARTRTGYALRTLLGDQGLLDELRKTLSTVADTARRQVALIVPSPGTWLAGAHHAAGTSLNGVSATEADSASMYVAEWLGKLDDLPVGVVILDARAAPDGLTESLADYPPISNVAGHIGWSVGLYGPDGVDSGAGPAVGIVEADFWRIPDVSIPDTDVLVSAIPVDAAPEFVLEQMQRLR